MRLNYSHPTYTTKEFTSVADVIVIGRRHSGSLIDLDLSPDSQVSHRQARITFENGEYWIEDLDSKHGTWLNEKKIVQKTRFNVGDKLRVGQTNLTRLEEREAISPASEINKRNIEGSITETISALDLSSILASSRKSDDGLLEAANRRLLAFYELSSALGVTDAVEPLLKTIVEHLQKAITNAQRSAVLLREGEELLLKAQTPEGSSSASMSLAKLAIDEQQAFIWRRTSTLTPESVVRHGIQCAIYAPMIWKGETLGVVYIDNSISEASLNEDDLRLVAALANQAAMFIKNNFLQQMLRREEVMRSNLMRQFSPKIAERFLKESGKLRLGGDRAEPVTILMSDVRGFTAMSAMMEPDDIMQMLNEMFGVFSPIIFKYNGTIDKYVGDAVLAIFGSPESDDHQWEKAVRAASEMQQAMRNLGDLWRIRGLPVCEVGIGIHTGEIVHGFIGSHERMEYTVIGDTVNKTSRYCDAAGRGEILISQKVYERVYRIVEASPKTIQTKHADTEGTLKAYNVISLK